MWGFDNGGDLSYELNKNAEIYQWSAGVQRLLPRLVDNGLRSQTREALGVIVR